jgi:hypothetical protein
VKLPLFFQPRDTYERHWVAARWLRAQGAKSVLDVGGEGLLRRFVPGVSCVSVNVCAPAEVLYDGTTLPFADASFDAVVSLDTLEHLPADRRPSFVEELLRVASRLVVLAAPHGSETHRRLEQEALAAYRAQRGEDHPYLREHVEYGLPTAEELQQLCAGHALEMRFCGDCRRQARAFLSTLRPRNGLLERVPVVPDMIAILRHANLGAVPRLDASAAEHSNRAYLFVQK